MQCEVEKLVFEMLSWSTQLISVHSMSYTRSDIHVTHSIPFHHIFVNLGKLIDFTSYRWLLLIRVFTIYIQLLEDVLEQDAELDLATVSNSRVFSYGKKD